MLAIIVCFMIETDIPDVKGNLDLATRYSRKGSVYKRIF